jgi:DNA-binding CsgD family transcriptional regulator
LPAELRRWMGASCEVSEGLGRTTLHEPAPLCLANRGIPLVIRLLFHPSGCLLLLREEAVDSDWKPLMQLGLSQREAQVLHFIAMGKTGPEIAILLGISHNTVRKHTSRIFIRLRVETRTAAALAAAEAGKLTYSTTYSYPGEYGTTSEKKVVNLLHNSFGK